MIFEAWDLLGSPMLARARMGGADCTDGVFRLPLRRVLVEPVAARGTNRKPHLLNLERPDVADLLDDEGNIAPDIRERTWLMRELLLPEKTGASPLWQDTPDRRLFRYWFDFQRGLRDEAVAGGGFSETPKRTVLAVPDFLGIKPQEALLSDSGFDRDKTRLLWRPVAAVLGAEERLETLGIAPGSRVAVLDVSPDGAYFDLCVLRMEKPDAGDWDGTAAWPHLVPCRATAPQQPGECTPAGYFETWIPRGGKNGKEETRFDFATRFNGSFWYPHGGVWEERTSAFQGFSPSLRNVNNQENRTRIAKTLSECAAVVSVGAPFTKLPPYPQTVPLLQEKPGENWILRGCLRYAERAVEKKPTYYDEIQPLYAIGQDAREEKIVAAELIPPRAKWPGGKEAPGKPHKGEIEAGSGDKTKKPYTEFRLCYGVLQRDTPLRVFWHEFDIQLDRNGEIWLHPSIVPGQGLARVKATGVPGTKDGELYLRFEEMKPERRQKGLFSHAVTMDVLEKEMDRSYPPDIPHVLPDPVLWDAAKWDVMRYLAGQPVNSDVFAHAQNIGAAAVGIGKTAVVASLQRINVFGSDPNAGIPSNADKATVDALFDKLLSDWKWYQTVLHPGNTQIPSISEDKLLRMVAWTYAPEPFAEIVDKTLEKAQTMAVNKGSGLSLQEYTLLANLVRDKDRQIKFMDAFAHQWHRYKDNPNTPFKHWVRAASYVLMFNNDATSHFDSRTHRNMMKDFHITLGRFNSELSPNATGVATQWHTHLFRAMLFLLKRRKIDKDFLPKDHAQDWLHVALVGRLKETILKFGIASTIGTRANAVLQFLVGKGALEGATIFNT